MSLESKPEAKRGGPRKGAGQPASDLKSEHVTLRVPYGLNAALKKWSAENGLEKRAAILEILGRFFKG